MKDIKFFGALLSIHVASILLFVITAGARIEIVAALGSFILILRYATTIFVIYLVYKKWIKRYNSIMLPISFIPVPVIFSFYSQLQGKFLESDI